MKPQLNETVRLSLLKEAGISTKQMEDRAQDFWSTMFNGSQEHRIYFPQGEQDGYMLDTGNNDARTEGMSYGMMMALQMDDKDVFDRLWRWSKTWMQQSQGPYEGYFAWSVSTSGVKNAQGPAPDGEEFFALALFFASRRWGDGPAPLDYSTQARSILRHCVHKGEQGIGKAMWEPTNKLIKFTPDCPWSDPSYHLPPFYELFAEYADQEDRNFWLQAAEASRDYLVLSCHPQTGLSPEYANYDGSPFKASWDYGHHHFYSDSYRVAANIGLDAYWTKGDPRHGTIMANMLAFFAQKELSELKMYAIDGTPLSEPALHPHGLFATLAMGALASPGPLAAAAVRRFYDLPLRTGPRRYYDNCLQLFAALALAGKYRIW